MKVLLLAGADQKYGTARMTLSMVRWMRENNEDIEYVVLTQKYGKINEECDRIQIENHVIPYRYCVYKPSRNKVLDFAKRNLKKVVIGMRTADAIHCVERDIEIGEIDIIHTNNNRDLFGAILQQKYGKPHVMHLREFTRKDFGLEMLFPEQIRYMNEYTDAYVAISNAIGDYWKESGMEPGKVHTIYDGVDVNDMQYQYGKPNDGIVRIVMCGNISMTKGQMQLARAIGKLAEKYRGRILVDFYGNGNKRDAYYKELQDYILKNGLGDTMHLLGYQENVRQKLFQYDIGLNCSKSEGFGLVTVEYMLAGVCPIVSNTGANKELVIDGKTGLVYKYGDAEELSRKIRSLLEDELLRETLSKNAREYALENFSLGTCMEKLCELYWSVLSGKAVHDVHG